MPSVRTSTTLYPSGVQDRRAESSDALQSAVCIGGSVKAITGARAEHIASRGVERQNLPMRMSTRRFTRLTNAFSNTIEDRAAGIALYCRHGHSERVHEALRLTLAMEAGVANHVWSAGEILALFG